MSTATEIAATKLQRLALPCRDVAELLGVSERQIWRLTSAGELPLPARVGQRARWDYETVMRWWRERQPES